MLILAFETKSGTTAVLNGTFFTFRHHSNLKDVLIEIKNTKRSNNNSLYHPNSSGCK